MIARLDWATDGVDWPNRSASRFVRSAGITWHIQEFGHGPLVLLVHGTAASTHSWRGLAPLLARTHTVLAMDLPGHGFTGPLPDAVNSLPNMAHAVGELLRTLDVKPACGIGHSAGAAILVQLAHTGDVTFTDGIVGLNAALLPFGGAPGRLFAPLTRLLAANPLLPRLFSWRAGDRAAVDRILSGTGSKLDAVGLELYARLFRNPQHVAAALEMMANWDLTRMADDIAQLRERLILIACNGDSAVPPDVAFQIRDRAPAVIVELVRGLGHLGHEEQPALLADTILRILASARPTRAAYGP